MSLDHWAFSGTCKPVANVIAFLRAEQNRHLTIRWRVEVLVEL
jgi:hypothetical protein